ncbi:hypothetical protein RCL_jg13414.t1 [Rhizophagus clarus]|uniref:Uncharacterized protein n=1 Tax=Rhizophagus clarus TaxID=94130 RepID=A0A8H3LS24_9GLOM|nr:hypothetical protein RCL_jg13414.t1 [Rhizophagus clarus]
MTIAGNEFKNILREDYFGRSPEDFERYFFKDIGYATSLNNQTIEVIYRSIEEIAESIYRTDVTSLKNNIERLKFRVEAQQKSHDLTSELSERKNSFN